MNRTSQPKMTVASSSGHALACRGARGAAVPMVAGRRYRDPLARREDEPASSDRLHSPLSLAPDLAQVRMEVDLDGMTLRSNEALPHLPFLTRDLPLHLPRRR
jgi:hypothetical protein